ncbi:site-specific integrase [Peribacillus sp. JNUCC 23]
MKTAQELVKEFEDYLLQKGIAPKTIESYTTDVHLFHDYIQANGVRDVTLLKRFYVTNYKQWLQDGGYAVATVRKSIPYNTSLQPVFGEQAVPKRAGGVSKEGPSKDCNWESKGCRCSYR